MKHIINYMPICPIDVLNKDKFDSDHVRSHVMVLAHLCKDRRQYKQFYKRKHRQFLLLDNGAAQNSQINDEQLISIVKDVNPTVVIAPDTLFDGESTITKTCKFIQKLHTRNIKCKVMAVPHGKTQQEYLQTFEYFNNNPNIDWIGVSKFVSVKPFTDRITCMLAIQQKINNKFNKPIHILGCNNPVQISFMKQFDAVKSIDSCIGYLYNNQQIPLDNSIQKRIDTPEQFFDWVLNQQQINQSLANVRKIDKLCKM